MFEEGWVCHQEQCLREGGLSVAQINYCIYLVLLVIFNLIIINYDNITNYCIQVEAKVRQSKTVIKHGNWLPWANFDFLPFCDFVMKYKRQQCQKTTNTYYFKGKRLENRNNIKNM